MRKTKELQIDQYRYRIKQMSAMQALDFTEEILRLGASSANASTVKAMVGSFLKTGEDVEASDDKRLDIVTAIIEFILGTISKCNREERKQIHNDMLSCITYLQSSNVSGHPDIEIPLNVSNADDFVQSQKDLAKLFWETLKLNYDFLDSVASSTVNSLREVISQQ